jgi:hypothetical protein
MSRLSNLILCLLGAMSCAVNPPPLLEVDKKFVFLPNICITIDSTLDPMAGMAVVRPKSCATIAVHPTMTNAPGPVFLFGILHEIMHISLHHVPTNTLPLEMARKQENEADCEAAKEFKRVWPHLVESLTNSIVFHITPSKTHGGVVDRAARIQQCLQSE